MALTLGCRRAVSWASWSRRVLVLVLVLSLGLSREGVDYPRWRRE